jgi:hypothetical protein
VHFYNPWTWFSASEAHKVEKLDAKLDSARDKAIKAAQKSAHETEQALDDKTSKNARNVAQESNQQTVTLLDQVAGPLTADELAAIRRQVTLLLSDNANLRHEGEVLRAENQKTVESLSEKLADLTKKLETAQSALPSALEREAAVANQYRNLVFGAYALGAIALIAFGVVVYLKFAYGGLPAAIGGLVSKVYTKHPEQASSVESMVKELLSPSQIQKIFGHSA